VAQAAFRETGEAIAAAAGAMKKRLPREGNPGNTSERAAADRDPGRCADRAKTLGITTGEPGHGTLGRSWAWEADSKGQMFLFSFS